MLIWHLWCLAVRPCFALRDQVWTLPVVYNIGYKGMPHESSHSWKSVALAFISKIILYKCYVRYRTWPEHALLEYCFLVLQHWNAFSNKRSLQESSVNLSQMITTLLLSLDPASARLTESGLAGCHTVFLAVPPHCNLIPFYNTLKQLSCCCHQGGIHSLTL